MFIESLRRPETAYIKSHCTIDREIKNSLDTSSTHIMPATAETNGNGNGATNGTGIPEHTTHKHNSSPYRAQDYLSNVSNFKIIESTLREGEQFANAFFDTETKVKIA